MEIVDPNLAFKKPLAPEEKVNQASPKFKKELIRKVKLITSLFRKGYFVIQITA